MEIIAREAAAKGGYTYDEEQGRQMKGYMVAEAEKQNNAYFATGQIWDEGIIDPRETRNYLKFCLSVIYAEKPVGAKEFGVFRM
jgi:acetyl-CoA carboxylase carboxyltransferase component